MVSNSDTDPILITVKRAAELLGLSTYSVYELAASGELGERRFIGNGRRNYRLEYASVLAYAQRLPTEPVEESA